MSIKMVKLKVYLLVGLLAACTFIQVESSILGFGKAQVPAHGDLVDYLDVKADRPSQPHSKLLEKFHAVVDANKQCDLEAQSKIILVCKNFDEGEQSAEILKPIERLYSVRKSFCETIANKTQIPSGCHKFLPSQNLGLAQKTLIRTELELANSPDLDVCIQQLSQHNHYWVSFSNNLRDAVRVSDVLRSDIELRHMIQNYRDFVSDFDSLRDALNSLHGETAERYFHFFEEVQILHNLQDETFGDFQRNFQNVSEKVFGGFDVFESVISARKAEIDKLANQATEFLVSFGEEFNSISEGLTKMKSGISDLYTEAAVQSTSLTKFQLNNINEIVNSVANELGSLDTGFEALNSQLDEWARMSETTTQLQRQHIVNAEKQLSMSEMMLDRQYEHYELANLTHESLQELYEKTQLIKERYEAYISIATLLYDNATFIQIVIGYGVLCILLAPFEKTSIGRKFSSVVKACFCLTQICIMVVDIITTKIGDLETFLYTSAFIVVLISASIMAGAVLLYYCFRYNRALSKAEDIEMTETIHREKPDIPVRTPVAQYRHFTYTPRTVRGGSAPPGM